MGTVDCQVYQDRDSNNLFVVHGVFTASDSSQVYQITHHGRGVRDRSCQQILNSLAFNDTFIGMCEIVDVCD